MPRWCGSRRRKASRGRSSGRSNRIDKRAASAVTSKRTYHERTNGQQTKPSVERARFDGACGDFGCAPECPRRARGVDCCGCEAGCIPARRALLLFSCYSGKRADRRFAPLCPFVESVGKISFCAVQRDASPVICLFNRGNPPTRNRTFPGKPWIFRKAWLLCDAAESARAV